ncbi:hypothetical protein [Amycolatopsis minnesotensis]|uniref:Uncharacterized protein n=1 Tax=Amycolatopsis minnesotensis TaxID=337894 RepID=A0ABN2SCI0_9PSEU
MNPSPNPRDRSQSGDGGVTGRLLTDGHGRYFLPVFLARADGTAEFLGYAIYADVGPVPAGVPVPRGGGGN